MFWKVKNIRRYGEVYTIQARGYRDAVRLRRNLGGKIIGGGKK